MVTNSGAHLSPDVGAQRMGSGRGVSGMGVGAGAGRGRGRRGKEIDLELHSCVPLQSSWFTTWLCIRIRWGAFFELGGDE